MASGVTATAYTPDQGEIRFDADGPRLEGAISLQGVGETAPALNGSDSTGTRYSVQTVVSLAQLKGGPDDVDRARARIAGAAVFVIDERDGGDFVYAPADSRTDLFPVEAGSRARSRSTWCRPRPRSRAPRSPSAAPSTAAAPNR